MLAHLTLGHWPIPDETNVASSDELSVVECGRAWLERHPSGAEHQKRSALEAEPSRAVLVGAEAIAGDVLLVDHYKAEKVRESDRLRAAIDAGRT